MRSALRRSTGASPQLRFPPMLTTLYYSTSKIKFSSPSSWHHNKSSLPLLSRSLPCLTAKTAPSSQQLGPQTYIKARRLTVPPSFWPPSFCRQTTLLLTSLCVWERWGGLNASASTVNHVLWPCDLMAVIYMIIGNNFKFQNFRVNIKKGDQHESSISECPAERTGRWIQ